MRTPFSRTGLSVRRRLSLLALPLLAGFVPAATAQVGEFVTLAEFTGLSGAKPGLQPVASLLQASDGNFYGTTLAGGTNNAGTVFRITSSGSFTNLLMFTGATGNAIGFYPYAGLVEHSTGSLYGITNGLADDSLAGITFAGFGAPFKISKDGSGYIKFFNFSGPGQANKGRTPKGTLFLNTDGNFWGTTEFGGAGSSGSKGHGTIFKMNAGGTMDYEVDFSNNGSSNKGSRPNARLVDGGDGYLYGSTWEGGTNNCGTLFKVQKSNGNLTTLVNFTDHSGSNPGKTPVDALLKASDGNFYGTTINGGSLGWGTVFRMTPAGVHTVLAHFTNFAAGASGAAPYGGLVQGNDGHLYGTTQYAGLPGQQPAGDHGTIFRLTLGGTLTPRLVDFTGTGGSFKGSQPTGGLVKGADGYIYGTTLEGGAGNFGTVFKFNPTTAATGAPTVNTGSATGVSGTGVTLNGTVNPNGLATTWQFEYGTTTSYGSSAPVTAGELAAGSSTQEVTTALSNLSQGTTYHYRLKATNSSGTNTGSDGTFTTTGSPQAPAVVTSAASGITGSSVTLNGTVNPRGSDTTWQFEYGADESYGSVMPATASGPLTGATAQAVNTQLTGLTPGTTVYYRLKATNTVGTVFGSGTSATTAMPPEVVTQAAIGVTNAAATLKGTVDPNGAETEWQFEYGPNSSYGQVAPAIPGTTSAGSTPETVTFNLTSLPAGSTWHYRLKAVNPSGTFYGENMTFTTKQPPAVATGVVLNITATGATLHGTVNPNGSPTTWKFDYGTTTDYGQSLPATPGDAGTGSSQVSVNVPVTGLLPNTAYHFRLSATNANGTATGGDAVFTTANNIQGWRQAYFQTTENTGNAANTFDADGDGIVNLLEYAFNMNPTVRDGHLLPKPSYNGSELITSFNQPSSVQDITYGAEVSTNLVNWASLADSGSGGAHTFTAPPSSGGRSYMRLKVTLNP